MRGKPRSVDPEKCTRFVMRRHWAGGTVSIPVFSVDEAIEHLSVDWGEEKVSLYHWVQWKYITWRNEDGQNIEDVLASMGTLGSRQEDSAPS